MNFIQGFFDWLSHVNLYPFYEAMNISSVFFFCIFWLLYPFLYVKRKLGFLKGALFTFIFAFMWISVIDELNVLANLNTFLRYGWNLTTFYYRWSWKFFFAYFTLKYSKEYGLLGKEIIFRKRTFAILMIFYAYYMLVPFGLFDGHNFRVWYLTNYERWFVYFFGNFITWIISTAAYVSLWKFKFHGMDFLKKYGIGEAYMLYALKRLLKRMKEKYGLNRVAEYMTVSSSKDFPDRDWDILKNYEDAKNYDLVFIFRAFPELVRGVAKNSGSLIVMASTNKRNPGYQMQKVLKVKGEHYATLEELKEQAKDTGLEIVETGYYDSPPWPDHSPNVIVPAKRFALDLGLIQDLLFFERFNNRFLSHHAFVVGKHD